MTAKLRQISARLPDELVHALEIAAEGSGRTKGEIVRAALEQYLVVTLANLLEQQRERKIPIIG